MSYQRLVVCALCAGCAVDTPVVNLTCDFCESYRPTLYVMSAIKVDVLPILLNCLRHLQEKRETELQPG